MTSTSTFTFQLGEPVEHRGIVDRAALPDPRPGRGVHHARRGAAARARDHRDRRPAASPSSRSTTRSTSNVLLYDGEELVGAKQNRILNVTVLVAAGATLPIPVSCVEQGRWTRARVDFDAGGHVSHAHLRRRKAEMLAATAARARGRTGRGLGRGRAKAGRMRSTRRPARPDTYHAHRDRARKLEAPSRSSPASAAPCSRSATTLCLDWVSRPDAFVRLWPKLRPATCSTRSSGSTSDPPTPQRVDGFVDAVADAPRDARRRPGSATTCASAASGVIGSGLELDGELIQLGVHDRTAAARVRPDRTAKPPALTLAYGLSATNRSSSSPSSPAGTRLQPASCSPTTTRTSARLGRPRR